MTELTRVPWVRFAVLALSSIFFLVDPFAAIPSFLAITESADPERRKRMARKACLTCFIVLTSFALGGQLIFRMFGITLPAFEIAGGRARRNLIHDPFLDTEKALAKREPRQEFFTGLYPALTCEPADFAWLFSFVVLIRDPTLPWERRPHCPTFGGIFGLDCANPWDACLAWREYR